MNKRYGMSIDIDKCTGCGACMVACAVENNVPPLPNATERRGITWMRVYKIDNGEEYPERRSAFVPMMCQQCGVDTPCAHVCPQQAVDVDPATGIVGQMPERCLGCRYCMAACPYHARYFNWWDPAWPAGMEKTLNPDVAPRMRGVVEKCNFCHGRWHRAKERAAAAGQKDIQPGDYVPACVEACPAGAIRFGDLNDRSSEVAAARQDPGSFRLLEKLGTDPKIYYHSKRDWVRQIANAPRPGGAPGETPRGTPGGTLRGALRATPAGALVGAPGGTPARARVTLRATAAGTPRTTIGATPVRTPRGTPVGVAQATAGGMPRGTAGGSLVGTPRAAPTGKENVRG